MSCDGDGECEVIKPGKITPKKLPKQSGGGGHEFVTDLPETGDEGVEYVLMDDFSDCNTYRGTFVWNEGCGGWIQTSGSGGGAVERYTFEQTATGWRAKRNNTVIFTYVDKDTIDSYENTADGFQITRNGVVIFTHTDGGGDSKEYTITATDDGWVFKEDGATKFTYTEPANDPSDGTYFTSGTLTVAITGTTTIAASSVTGLTLADVVIGETLIYDKAGTVGRVTAVNGTNLTVETVTTAPGERRGTRLGAVDDYTNLPATCAAAVALGWQSPLAGDFAYVRTDTSHDKHLTEWVISSVDSSCNVTWAYSHTLNAGNYVLDIYKYGDYPSGNPIPKNADGSVTLPKDENTKYDFENLMDGTAIKGWRVKDHDTGTILYTYTDLNDNAAYSFENVTVSGKVVGWRVKDNSGTVIYTYTDLNDKSDGTYFTSATLDTGITDQTTVATNTVTGLTLADVVVGETLIYDGNGTVGVVSAVSGTNLTVDTITVAGSGDASSYVYKTTGTLDTTVDNTVNLALSTLSNSAGTAPTASDIIIGKTLAWDKKGTVALAVAISGTDVTFRTISSSSTTNIIYNTERQGEELKSSYAVFSGGDFTPTIDAIVPFKQATGTFEQPEVGEFIIPDGTRIEANFNLTTKGDKSTSNVRFAWFNITDNKQLPTGAASTFNNTYQGKYLQYPRTNLMQWTNDTGHAVTIALKVITVDQITSFSSDGSSLTIQEIGRIVDPMKYADNSKGFEDVPVGSIVEMYQDTAPAHYLICDGTEYNIGSHPELEAKIVEQFGKLNQFGGDGIKTYAVPDLRTEESVTPKPVSASSPYTVSATSIGNGQPASLSFNGELDAGWLPDLNSTEEQYIRIDFTQKTRVEKYELFTRSLDQNDLVVYPRDFTLEGSNDNGATWEVLDTRTGETAGARQQRHTYEVATPGFYTSYRIGATANNGLVGVSSYIWAVGEINLIGTSPLQKFIKYESTMKAFYGAGNYKVSGTFQIPGAGAWSICNLTGTTGDTDMVQDGKIVVPQTGWYSLTAQYGVANSNGMETFVTWQNRSDVVNGTNQLDKNLCMNYKSSGSYAANTLSGTAYLEKGDIVTLQMKTGQAIANAKPTFTVAFMGSDITINQVNLIGADDVYSTEEQMVGSYLGKPLYKRTVTHQINSTNNIFDYSVISPNVDKDCIVKYKGRMINADNGSTVAGIPCYYTSERAHIDCWFGFDGIHIYLGTLYGVAGRICEITYYYTKTTDTAGSAPNKNSLLLTRPDLWEAGVEYDFGGGLYGQRFTADSFTPLAIVEYVEGVSNIVSSSGIVYLTSNNAKLGIPFSTVNQSDSSCTYPYFSIRDIVNGKGTLSITSGALLSTQVGNGWDAWATYTK